MSQYFDEGQWTLHRQGVHTPGSRVRPDQDQCHSATAVCRYRREDGAIVYGKVHEDHAWFPWDGKEQRPEVFEVLGSPRLEDAFVYYWETVQNIVANPNLHTLYGAAGQSPACVQLNHLARGEWHCGKILFQEGIRNPVVYVSYGGREHRYEGNSIARDLVLCVRRLRAVVEIQEVLAAEVQHPDPERAIRQELTHTNDTSVESTSEMRTSMVTETSATVNVSTDFRANMRFSVNWGSGLLSFLTRLRIAFNVDIDYVYSRQESTNVVSRDEQTQTHLIRIPPRSRVVTTVVNMVQRVSVPIRYNMVMYDGETEVKRVSNLRGSFSCQTLTTEARSTSQ